MSGWAQRDAERTEDDREEMAAKDAEIAKLQAAVNLLQGDHIEATALLLPWKNRARQAESERDEARKENAELRATLAAVRADRNSAWECVKRLSSALCGLFGADLQTCMVERDGHDDQIEAVEAARAALAAIPESLR